MVRHAAHVPPAIAEVLGMPPWQLHIVWMSLRETGVEIPTNYEAEVSAALFFLLPFAIKHGEAWRQHAIDELQALGEGKPFKPFGLLAQEPVA